MATTPITSLSGLTLVSTTRGVREREIQFLFPAIGAERRKCGYRRLAKLIADTDRDGKAAGLQPSQRCRKRGGAEAEEKPGL